VRRGTFLAIFSFLLLGCGIAFFVDRARTPSTQNLTDPTIYAGAALLVLAAASAIFSRTVIRRGCRLLQAHLSHLISGGKLTTVEAPEAGLRPLVRSINDLIQYAEQSVSDAAMRLKELELQLKVVTAQRITPRRSSSASPMRCW